MDELCNRFGDWSTIDRVMSDWKMTNSPQVHWYNQLHPSAHGKHHQSFRLDPEAQRNGQSNMSYGLPTEEALRVCKERYKYDVVKLTLQITEHNVLQIKKDIRVTFADKLAGIGNPQSAA